MEPIQIIKTISKYIKIDLTVYIIALISIFTASYNIFIIISFLIFIHELGHFLCAKILNIEVDKIIIYPLGGISKFNLPLNSSQITEFLILISGPLFQFLAYILLKKYYTRYTELIDLYHYGILFFNLLPVYPLDGGKLINLLLSYFLPYKLSLKATIFISYVFILLLILMNCKHIYINLIIIIIFLVYKVAKEQVKIPEIYNKFLLERYLNKYKFKHSKIINSKEKFYRNRRHLIKVGDKYYLEDEYLEKKYRNYKKSVDYLKSTML